MGMVNYVKEIKNKPIHYSNSHFPRPYCGVGEDQYHEAGIRLYSESFKYVTCERCLRKLRGHR